jgi:hypothetical protein
MGLGEMDYPDSQLMQTAEVRSPPKSPPKDECLVMFSGGRDSTIAALRLSRRGVALRLVTVSSGHLFGIERVSKRIRELQPILPAATLWVQVKQPTDLRTDTSFYEMTCLPCHHSYVVVSGVLASLARARRLAFGYAKYQSDWPEQSPLAIDRLASVLNRHGIGLELPAYDLSSREAAIRELTEIGLSVESLEQKCMQQISNVALAPDRLVQQIDLWERAIDQSMSRLEEVKLEILNETPIGNV